MPHDGPHSHSHDHAHPHDPVTQHRREAVASVACFVLTCSDTRDARTDEGGPLVRAKLEGAGHVVVGAEVVKDEAAAIRAAVEHARSHGARAILITGGTGLSPRDVTLEAVAPLFEKEIPGFGELFRMLSFQEVGSAAMLSRAAAGVSPGAVVFALPGSPKAVALAMDRLILPELGHLIRQLTRG
jgi:molybdenum cofactor biosynthesis protein B